MTRLAQGFVNHAERIATVIEFAGSD